MTIPELLCPAGNFEKLKSAISFGADAVYLGGKSFGMRAAADNFTLPELSEALGYAHALEKKVYLTLNTMPAEDEIEQIWEYLIELSRIGGKPDAFIVADLGIITLVRELFPETAVHVSTQAGVANHLDCAAWYKMGASRVILARELTLEDIKKLRDKSPPELELEAFVHGSMCVSYSGRCLLSNHFTGRDANRGQCTQSCRWKYKIYELEEEKRPGQRLDIMENDRGTFIMSSRDMCMIEHIPGLCEAGLASLKIEGRVKSAYYAAVTANAYRMALDSYGGGNYSYDEKWLRELESVSHRPYCTGFFMYGPQKDANMCGEDNFSRGGYTGEKSYAASVLSYDAETGKALCIQKNKIFSGGSMELLTPKKTGQPFEVKDLEDENGIPIDSTPHPGMRFRMKIPFGAKGGDIIRN